MSKMSANVVEWSMDFPIVDLLDDDLSEAWLLKYFPPLCSLREKCGGGAVVPHDEVESAEGARGCQGVYDLYSGTVFEEKRIRPAQVVLLLRGICKGKPTATIAEEIGVARQAVHKIRKRLQANAERLQPETPLSDERTERDEMFQNAGEK